MSMNNGTGQKRELPHWLQCTVNKVVMIWTSAGAGAVTGFFAHAGDGFIELIQRDAEFVSGVMAQTTFKYRHTFIHIQHICRIEPAEAQWQLPRLAVPEAPKLVLPS